MVSLRNGCLFLLNPCHSSCLVCLIYERSNLPKGLQESEVISSSAFAFSFVFTQQMIQLYLDIFLFEIIPFTLVGLLKAKIATSLFELFARRGCFTCRDCMTECLTQH